MAPGVLSTKLETTFQKVRVARYIQVHRLQQRPNVGEGASLVAGLRGFDGIANFHSRDWQKTNAPSNCLIVIVIGEVIEVEHPGGLRIIGDEARPIGNIKGIICAHRADREPTARLETNRLLRQNTVENSEGAIRQFIDPKRVIPFDKNVDRREKLANSQ